MTQDQGRSPKQQSPINRPSVEYRTLVTKDAVRVAPGREIDLTRAKVRTLRFGDERIEAVVGVVFGSHDPGVVEHVDIRRDVVAAQQALEKARGSLKAFADTLERLNEMGAETAQMEGMVQQAELAVYDAEQALMSAIALPAAITIEQSGKKFFRVTFSNSKGNWPDPDLVYDVMVIEWPAPFGKDGTTVLLPMSRFTMGRGWIGFFAGTQTYQLTFLAVSGQQGKNVCEAQFALRNAANVAYFDVFADGEIGYERDDYSATATTRIEADPKDQHLATNSVAEALVKAGGAEEIGSSPAEVPAEKPDGKDRRHHDRDDGNDGPKKPRRRRQGHETEASIDAETSDEEEVEAIEAETPVPAPEIPEAEPVGEGVMAAALAAVKANNAF